MWCVGAGYAGLGAATAWKLYHSEEAYDLDSGHERWAKLAEPGRQQGNVLPSAYSPLPPEGLRYEFGGEAAAKCATGSAQLDCRALQLDSDTQKWVETQLRSPRTPRHSLAAGVLSCLGIGERDAEALLDAPAVHLLSAAQWAEVLGREVPGPEDAGTRGAARRGEGVALDVGAGSGHITEAFAPLFAETCAVEISDWLVWRLGRRGFRSARTSRASAEEMAAAGLPSRYDAVFALNVLDRVDDGEAFLRSLTDMVKPGGLLVVSLPLPFCALSWLPAAGPSLDRPLRVEGETWEEAAANVTPALESSGLKVLRLVRAPYLCQGWRFFGEPLYCLDGAVFVARRTPEAGSE